ncbi:MAG: Kazal-type serine protease inhibitor family protein [Xanthobacteraceae bacterium]|jgi:hypothetical protein
MRLLVVVLTLFSLAFAVQRAGAAAIGDPCGGTDGTACDTGLYCQLDSGGCGNAVAAGKCIRAPRVCAMVYSPVCACGGKTYGNDCELHRAGVQKAHNGRCGVSGFRAQKSEPDASKNQ